MNLPAIVVAGLTAFALVFAGPHLMAGFETLFATPAQGPIQPPAVDVLANAPAVVANRIPLPACGVEHGDHAGPRNLAGRACFWKAYQVRQPAEFISTLPTTEGDPITTIYRVLPDGAVELFIDSTQDTFGSGRWAHATCRTLASQVGSDISFGPDDTCIFADIP